MLPHIPIHNPQPQRVILARIEQAIQRDRQRIVDDHALPPAAARVEVRGGMPVVAERGADDVDGALDGVVGGGGVAGEELRHADDGAVGVGAGEEIRMSGVVLGE